MIRFNISVDWEMWFWNCGGWRYQAWGVCYRICWRRWLFSYDIYKMSFYLLF